MQHLRSAVFLSSPVYTAGYFAEVIQVKKLAEWCESKPAPGNFQPTSTWHNFIPEFALNKITSDPRALWKNPEFLTLPESHCVNQTGLQLAVKRLSFPPVLLSHVHPAVKSSRDQFKMTSYQLLTSKPSLSCFFQQGNVKFSVSESRKVHNAHILQWKKYPRDISHCDIWMQLELFILVPGHCPAVHWTDFQSQQPEVKYGWQAIF